MAETIPNKLYKTQEQSGAISYQLLPGTNTPSGFTEVTDPQEAYSYLNQLRSMGQYIPGRAGETGVWFDAQQVARDLETTLANYKANPSSGLVASYQAPWGETLTNIPQSQIEQIESQQQQFQRGELTNFQTQAGKPPLYVPIGTPQPGASFAQQLAGPAGQIPGVVPVDPNAIPKKFEQAFNAAKGADYQAPTDAVGAKTMLDTFVQEQQGTSVAENFIAQDPYLNQTIQDYQQYMSSQNQRTSLVDTYKSMLKESGIEQIDMDLINMKNVIEGSEDDIRTEITKAGGFATESQVLALTNARNKQLIKNYNTLVDIRNSKSQYLDTMMNLTQQDRAEADRLFETQMNFGFKIAEINQQMKQNAISTIDRVAKTLGWDGVYEAAQGNPQLISQIERTYGLPQGGLYQAAQRAFEARQFAEQERQLGLQEKQLGIQLKGEQIAGLPLERQLKLEQIKTEQAQRAKIYTDIQKIQDSQKGSVLDPRTPEGAKQLATMQGKVTQIGSILTSSALPSTVGPTSLFRGLSLQGIVSKLSGAKQNFIGDVEQLRSGLNLDSLIDAKSRGATFGALSDQELQVLSNSATKIGVWAIKDKSGNVVGYNTNERDFRKELDKINNFAKLDYIYRGGNPVDVGVQIINGKYYTKNSDGSITEL